MLALYQSCYVRKIHGYQIILEFVVWKMYYGRKSWDLI